MRSLYVAVCVLVLLAPGCQPAKHVDPEPRHVKSSAIILVPGFKGTALARADTGKRVWITVGQALFGDASLAWHQAGLGLSAAQPLRVDGLLLTVPILPGLWALDVYGSLRAALQTRFAGEADIVELPYDWRQDPLDTVHALASLVARLRAGGARSVSLVAHSFGGLIVAYYLRYGEQDLEDARETWGGAQQVEKVIVMGAPFLGAMTKFRDMLLGETVGLNTSLLDAAAHASFPSSYFLLPAPTEAVFMSPGGDALPVSLYRPSTWDDEEWGLLARADTRSPQLHRARLAFVSTYLHRGARLSGLVNAPPRRVPPDAMTMLPIVGHGRATLAYATRHDHALTFTLSEDGDGIVTARSAQLPAAYRPAANIGTIETKAAHQALWAGENVQERILLFLATNGTGDQAGHSVTSNAR